jgi:hypothetical protein
MTLVLKKTLEDKPDQEKMDAQLKKLISLLATPQI